MSTVDKLEFLSDIRNRKTIIIEAVVFQLLWFACVLGDTWVWVTAGILYSLFYVFLLKCSRYLVFIAVAGTLGVIVDYVKFSTGAMQFSSGSFPVWLVGLWYIFVSSIPIAFSFLRGRYVLASVLGGLGGMSSYFSASLLRSDVTFYFGEGLGLLPLALVWALLMPTLLYTLERLETLDLKKSESVF